MKFYKYQALGNDYIVLDPADGWIEPSTEQICQICDRHYGVGSDGILFGPFPSDKLSQVAAEGLDQFGVRIFNPDGSLAEKSGNGLRIFACHLWEKDLVGSAPFVLFPEGGPVVVQMAPGGRYATLDLGRATFNSREIPAGGPPRQILDEVLTLEKESVRICAVSLGNPHCVVLLDAAPEEGLARRLGPQIENHPLFPRRTNVQFLFVQDHQNLQIEIWERGVGHTLASGTSSAAAAAAAYRLGLCETQVAVHMPGGTIQVNLEVVEAGPEIATVRIAGPVSPVCEGILRIDI